MDEKDVGQNSDFVKPSEQFKVADRRGMVQVYTGNGKGKTTASLGLGLRALGHGWKVYMIQFMKGRINYGELEAVKNLPSFTIEQFGRPDFVDKENPAQVDIDFAQQGLARAKEVVSGGKYDMVILDEMNVALDYKLVPEEEVLAMIKNRPEHVEIVLTGRNAPESILAIADLVSRVGEEKHPYQKGVQAREGIEF